jgi:hypothetical protein
VHSSERTDIYDIDNGDDDKVTTYLKKFFIKSKTNKLYILTSSNRPMISSSPSLSILQMSVSFVPCMHAVQFNPLPWDHSVMYSTDHNNLLAAKSYIIIARFGYS